MLKKWLAARRKAKTAKRFHSGFSWAIGEMLQQGTQAGAEEVRSRTEAAKYFGDFDDFDRGADFAVKLQGAVAGPNHFTDIFT